MLHGIRLFVFDTGNTPQFSFGTSVTVTVPESSASGAAVYVFTVTDADPQDTITMEMVSTDNSFFRLDINNSKYYYNFIQFIIFIFFFKWRTTCTM